MSEESNDHQLADDEIITLVEQMLDAGEIGVYPYYNSNGADSYECPSCGKSTRIVGHALGQSHLLTGEHEEDCNAVKLMLALRHRETD